MNKIVVAISICLSSMSGISFSADSDILQDKDLAHTLHVPLLALRAANDLESPENSLRINTPQEDDFLDEDDAPAPRCGERFRNWISNSQTALRTTVAAGILIAFGVYAYKQSSSCSNRLPAEHMMCLNGTDWHILPPGH